MTNKLKPTKAVFFDFGGVITQSPFDAFNSFEETEGIRKNFIREVNSVNPDTNAWARFERNDITLDQFDELFAKESKQLGHQISGYHIIKLIHGKIRPEMISLVKKCRRKYKTACLTNNIAFKPNECDLDYNENWRLARAEFDYVIESSKISCRKPEIKFYEYACRLVEVEPPEVIFLDDLGINLKPAKEMGMYTIKVVSPNQAITELNRVIML